jgi:transcriptional regulator with XRE-family HTH domain
MTPDELRAVLAELGWKQADFARRAGLNKDTPGRWLSGTTPIPEWVSSYLGTVLDVARLHAKYVKPIKGEESPST